MNRILISDSSNESSIDDLLRAAGSYFLSEEQAKRILSEVLAAMRQWRKLATACHISPAEQQRFCLQIGFIYLIFFSLLIDRLHTCCRLNADFAKNALY